MDNSYSVIPLSGGGFAMVDPEDFEYLSQWKWKNKNGYAVRNKYVEGKWKAISMHRELLRLGSEKEWVDHINFNRADNRKSNLRIATPSQNAMHRRLQNVNTSGFKGVKWHKRQKKWNAVIEKDDKRIHIGCYTDKIEAARAYNEAASLHFGEFAQLNVI